MKKFKAFFAKIWNYIKNSAWIQPILIVVVIFVVLFSLNPIANAIKSGWTKLTTVNDMEKITFEEYTQKVEAQAQGNEEDFIIVFSSSSCEICPILFKSVNEYLKSDSYKEGKVKIYNVDLSLKSTKVKVDGTKYKRYKDSTAGLYATSESVFEKDAIRNLDVRLQKFVGMFENGYSGLAEVESGEYKYVSTPLVLWYSNGIETRASNTFGNSVELKSDGKQATPSSFKEFITDFQKETTADVWNETFNLKPFTGNLKD